MKKFSESSDFEFIKECEPDFDHFQRTKTRGSWISWIFKNPKRGVVNKIKEPPASTDLNQCCVCMAPSPRWLLGRFFDLLTVVFRKSKNQSDITIILNK